MLRLGNAISIFQSRTWLPSELTGAHALKQVQIFVNRSITVELFHGLGQRASRWREFVQDQGTDVGLTFANRRFGILINLLKIVRRMSSPSWKPSHATSR